MEFTEEAIRRIVRAVLRSERDLRNGPVRQPVFRGGGGDDVRWFKLTADLDAGGTATAWEMKWSAADSAYTADETTEFTLTDTVGQHWGLTGEVLPAQTIYSSSGPVHEVLAPGAPTHDAVLYEDLVGGSSAQADVTVGTGSDEQTVTLTVYDKWLASGSAGETIAADSVVRIYYDVLATKWYADLTQCANVT